MRSLMKALLLTALSHVANLQPTSRKCPVLKAVEPVHWETIQDVDWYEILNHPGPLDRCVVRKYLPEHQMMTWKEKTGPFGNVTRFKKYAFILGNGQQFLTKDKSFFQQVLGTDHHTWALLHICAEGDGKSKLTLTLREPLSVIPMDIDARIEEALRYVELPHGISWTRSPCMIDSTVNNITLTKEEEPLAEPTPPRDDIPAPDVYVEDFSSW